MTTKESNLIAASRCRRAARQEIGLLRARKAVGHFDGYAQTIQNIQHFRKMANRYQSIAENVS